MTRTIRTDRAREAFLGTLEETCNVSEAARVAGIGRRSAYEWRDAEPEFAAAWDEAEQIAADKLEKVAWDRATGGQSDRMLELLLKAHRPEKFKERVANEHSGPSGAPIRTETKTTLDLAGLSDEQLRALASIRLPTG